MFTNLNGYSQIRPLKDTITINDETLDERIEYSARDSIFSDLKSKKVHLYGEAKVLKGEISIKAGYILIDLNNNEVFASYVYGKDSIKTELPNFSDGSEQIKAQSIRYNFDTEKGFIEELAIQQDEIYLNMGLAKRHSNEQIHFIKGRFTTCNLEDPHYHFQLSKAVLIPKDKIVTGPINLWIKGVPTPLGLPFSIIPQQKERTHGILFPEIVPGSTYGFGVQNLGYYFPINDHLQTSAYINLYSRGSWGIRNNLDYFIRYKFRGNLNIGFEEFKRGFPDNTSAHKLSVFWNHKQEQRSNPYWLFGSSVNFISDNEPKNNLDPLNQDFFRNSFNSDVFINRLFPGKPVTMGMKLSVRQNAITNNIALIAPVLNVNVTRFFPFKNSKSGGFNKFISRIGVTYNFEGQNRATFDDTLLQKQQYNIISNHFLNGINQNMIIQTTSSFFRNTIKFNPYISYSNKINFQQFNNNYDTLLQLQSIDTLQKVGMLHELSMNANFSTIVYSYYKFIGKRNTVMRHLLTPTIGFRYTPQLNPLNTVSSTYQPYELIYSSFERSLYPNASLQSSGLITFGINNTFELKYKSDKDTLTGFKRLRIVDVFSINGSYDLIRDSMNLSDIALNLRVSPFEWVNFVASTSFSPYAWLESSGATIGQYATQFNNKLGRFSRSTLSTTLTFTSQEGRKRLENTQQILEENWNADYNFYSLHPEFLLDFKIPWKVSLSHIFGVDANTNKLINGPDDFLLIQTLVTNADLSFTKRWKLSTTINFDFYRKLVTNARFGLSRDMHCWAMNFSWTPIGGNKSFLLSIRNTSSLFQDAKIDIRKPPVFL